MNVKLILYDETRKLYKVKNAKTDEGTVIMRRRTWRDLETGYDANNFLTDIIFLHLKHEGDLVQKRF